jgi:kexin
MGAPGPAPLRVVVLSLVSFLLAACPTPTAGSVGFISFFRATPLDIAPGDSVQLTWEAQNAAGCLLSPDIGEVPASGANLVTPQVTTTYELTCNGGKRHLTINVSPLVSITRFGAMPVQTVADGPVELSWATVGATSCAVTPGVGEVDVNGTHSVMPSQTATYTLTCKGTGPNAVATTTVEVVPVTTLEVPTNLSVTAQDGMLRVTWTQGAGSANVYFAEASGIEVANIDSKPGRAIFRRVVSPFTISGLVDDRTYYLRISSVSGTTESGLSNEVTGTPAGPTTGSDPYFGEQWHLSNNGEDLDVLPVWALGLKGEGVKVAVVDEGIDQAHEDLRQNMLTGASKDYLGNTPVRLAEHGTCVAGLIAARDLNGIGLRGVAPRAGMMSFNLLQSLTSGNEYDAMVRQKDVVAVSNNSWGEASDNTGLLTFADPLWMRGVAEGATTGRGGKGVVYFWASGNGGDVTEGGPDDSNYDSQANSRYVIAVGGVGKDGKRPAYAEGGANVLIVAPTQGNDGAALVTTDITGAAGYNAGNDPHEHPNPNYSSTMNGTSGSTPLALGVGALVLQVRPELSWRDVRRVLAYSARRNDQSSPGWATNGAGLHVNQEYGFGVVDANAAVLLARTIVPVGPEVSYPAPLMQPNLAIPDNDGTGASSQVTVAGSGIGHVEVIEVEISVTHARTADLEIILRKSGGAQDVLMPLHDCSDPNTGATTPCSDIDAFVFTSVRHLDEPADGQWTLTVKDRRAGTTGTLTSWQLRIYGSN